MGGAVGCARVERKVEGVCDHCLVEGRLRGEHGWKGNRRVGEGKEVVKACELNL